MEYQLNSQINKKLSLNKSQESFLRNKSQTNTQRSQQQFKIKNFPKNNNYNINTSNPSYAYSQISNSSRKNQEYFGMTKDKIMQIISPQQTPQNTDRYKTNQQLNQDQQQLKRKKVFKDIRQGSYRSDEQMELNNSNLQFQNQYQSHYQQQYIPKQMILQSRVHNHNQEVGTKYLNQENRGLKRVVSQGHILPSLNNSQQNLDEEKLNQDEKDQNNQNDVEQQNRDQNNQNNYTNNQDSNITIDKEKILSQMFENNIPQENEIGNNSNENKQQNKKQENQCEQAQNNNTNSNNINNKMQKKNKEKQKNIEEILSILTDNQHHKYDAQLHEFIKENPDFLLHLQQKCACFQCKCGKCRCKASKDVISKPSYQNLKSQYKTTFNSNSNSKNINNVQIKNKIYQQPKPYSDDTVKDQTTQQADFHPQDEKFNQDQFQPIKREHRVNRDLKFFNPQTSYEFDFPRYDNYDRFIIKNVSNITTNDKMPFIKNTTYQTSFKNGNNFSSQRIGNQKAQDDLEKYKQNQNLIHLKPETSASKQQFKSFKIDPSTRTEIIRYKDNDPLPNGAPAYKGQFESLTSKMFKVNKPDRETQSVDVCPVQNDIRQQKNSYDYMRDSLYSVSSSRSGLRFQFKSSYAQ